MKHVQNSFYSSRILEEYFPLFSTKNIQKVLSFQQTHKKYTHTPLLSLDHLAKDLCVKDIYVKDESTRFGLNAFKVMGAIYAMGKYLAEKLGTDMEYLSFQELQSKKRKDELGEITFISATDGNHGRAVAWAARELGQHAVIHMPKGSSKARLEAIRAEGATAVITDVNYDETVRRCATLADEKGWVMVQDTAWEGYEKIPLWIMEGYAAIAKEIVDDIEIQEMNIPTHIILQAGVGSFAAGIAAFFAQYYNNNVPKIIVVEPNKADCYYRSFKENQGEIQAVTGDMDSIMAGLCCGEPNIRAFKILKQYSRAFYSCDDRIAALGMRILSSPLEMDRRVTAGESGAAPLGLLYYLKKLAEKNVADDIGLNEDATVLVINTEGNTDPEQYKDIVWKGAFSM